MRKKVAALALTAGLAATGGAALVLPGSASAADTPNSAKDRAASRLTGIKDALTGLVGDGTLTQAQADKVATTLSTSEALRGPGGPGRHGGPGGHLDPAAIAKVLGITTDALRTAEDGGKTLAQIADGKGISKADLITRLVAAAKAELAADVTAGRLTQAQSDTAATTLTADITRRVDEVRPARGDHRGPGGPGDRRGPGTPPGTPGTAPSPVPSPQAS